MLSANIEQIAKEQHCTYSVLGNSIVGCNGRLKIADDRILIEFADYFPQSVVTSRERRVWALERLKRAIISWEPWGDIGFKAAITADGIASALEVIGVLSNSQLLQERSYDSFNREDIICTGGAEAETIERPSRICTRKIRGARP